MRSKPLLLLIGAIPPPVIGPSLAMERLIASPELHAQFEVSFLDISDHRSPTTIGRFDWINLLLGLKHCFQCLGRLILKKPDLLYVGISQGVWGYLRDLSFLLPSLLLRRRIVLHLRGSEFRQFYDEMPACLRWLTRVLLARARRVIVLGHCLKSIFHGLVETSRIAVIPNGIDYEPFTRPDSAVGERRRSRPAGPQLLYLSSLRKRKGMFVLLEAFGEVLSRHPDATMTIAGCWQSESDRAQAQELISRLGLAEKLQFVGEVSGAAKIRLFMEHDIFVFTPVQPEGLPWVILEAMSASLPVVTTNQGAIAEVVEHCRTGLIASPTSAEIAERVCYLIENRYLARRMGEEGRKRVEQHFSEKAYLSKLIALFREVASNGSPAAEAPLSARKFPTERERCAN